MQCTVQPDSDSIAVVSFEKHVFGGPQAVEFSTKLGELAGKNVRWVIADLGQVELMNSSGLGMLVGGLTAMRRVQGAVKLANVPEKVLDLLRITRLNTVFESYPSVEEAVRSCQ